MNKILLTLAVLTAFTGTAQATCSNLPGLNACSNTTPPVTNTGNGGNGYGGVGGNGYGGVGGSAAGGTAYGGVGGTANGGVATTTGGTANGGVGGTVGNTTGGTANGGVLTNNVAGGSIAAGAVRTDNTLSNGSNTMTGGANTNTVAGSTQGQSSTNTVAGSTQSNGSNTMTGGANTASAANAGQGAGAGAGSGNQTSNVTNVDSANRSSNTYRATAWAPVVHGAAAAALAGANIVMYPGQCGPRHELVKVDVITVHRGIIFSSEKKQGHDYSLVPAAKPFVERDGYLMGHQVIEYTAVIGTSSGGSLSVGGFGSSGNGGQGGVAGSGSVQQVVQRISLRECVYAMPKAEVREVYTEVATKKIKQ